MAYSTRKGLTIPIIVLVGLAITYSEFLPYVLGLIGIIIGIKIIVRLYKICRTIVRNCTLKDVDRMDGLEFEKHIARKLRQQDYHKVRLTERYDYGVDIIAEKDGVRWGIQAKRYSGLVKAEAVRQVIAGLNIYGCDRAIVVTNSLFSSVAQKLAVSNDCVLVDRNSLARFLG